jgi:hypothetical protein
MEQSLEGMIPLPTTFLPTHSFWSVASFKASLQPWGDFFSPSQLVKPDAHSLNRLRFNLRHFQGNYVVLTLLIVFVYL